MQFLYHLLALFVYAIKIFLCFVLEHVIHRNHFNLLGQQKPVYRSFPAIIRQPMKLESCAKPSKKAESLPASVKNNLGILGFLDINLFAIDIMRG